METHLHSDQPQLRLPLTEGNGVGVEVSLPFSPDESVAYGTPRLKGSFSSRVDEVVAPRRTAALAVDGERFFAKVVVRGQSYEVSGSVVARQVRPFGEPDADFQTVVERVDFHAARKYVNGTYVPCPPTLEVEKAAERAVRDGYAQALASAGHPAEHRQAA